MGRIFSVSWPLAVEENNREYVACGNANARVWGARAIAEQVDSRRNGKGVQPAADCRRLRVFPQHRPAVVPAGRCDTMIRAATVASSQPHPLRSLAGKPLAGFCATPIRRKPVLWGIVVHVLHR